ncbi:hypothetical protein EUTSA_v10026399mg [Eutrema salsugineum]|uniref:Maternal effect embryo arrest 59 n=1 Tax=Eutrema salsugineum TaxID=72664 RepID=V4MDQ5_EUTSA|nr:uncharacterized protein LOC18030606 [Eutrema salsugineum]ESQ53357.1 hypothetical protein EUTSA_v10026399mg [Eutrema salsugineum]
MSAMKPSRSDEIPDPDQQIKNSNQIRADFDSLAPKRPTKPTRSEPEPLGSFSASDQTTDHPEADKFRSLQSQAHGNILCEGDSSAIQDEFLETQYYTNLTAIDKQHHTTGSGFINVVNEDGGEEAVTAAAAIEDGGEKAVYRSNPATNDWIPAAEEDHASESSSKPNRSESS